LIGRDCDQGDVVNGLNGDSDMSRPKKRPDQIPLKPLRGFDFALVNNKFDGFLFNVNRDLERKAEESFRRGHRAMERCFSLLRVFVNFANNSYRAMRYLSADTPEDSKRDLKYVLVVPTVSRQLVDILCTIVYMLDELIPRAYAYQRAGYRELRDVQHLYKTNFSDNSEWKDYFNIIDTELKSIANYMKITDEEVKDPKLIPFWKHPFELKNEQTKSRDYLRYLDKWVYSELSAQSHLSFAGLLRVWPVLVANDVGGEAKQMVDDRFLPQFRGHAIGVMAVVTLAIATEVDTHCKLGNSQAADYLWAIFGEYLPETKEMYELRYQSRQR
jgi:hypothetical protein